MIPNDGRDKVAGRLWSRKPYRYFYVAQLPGEGGKDWGYTTDFKQSRLLSVYWQRRFANDCAFCGYTAQFYER